MTIVKRPVVKGPRVYPHVNEVPDSDWQAKQTIRLLWDRLHDLSERLLAHDGTLDDLIAGHNANAANIDATTKDAKQALALSQVVGTETAPSGATPGGGDGGQRTDPTLPGGGDGGDGATGCAAAGPTGHDTGGLLNAVRAGQIICGTGNEFSWLKNVAPDQATRDANVVELLRRMIWHLKLAGFTAGRQRNPSGLISNDKLCVEVDAVLRAYDVFSLNPFDQPFSTHMIEVGGPQLVDDAGIPD